jgi:exonuclease III
VDILALTKTHHFPDQQLLVILGYQHFAVARPGKVSGQVRKHSGGILIYVSELCNSEVSVLKAAKDGTKLWLKFTDLGNSKPLFLCITYVPPQNSPYVDKALYDHIAQEIAEAESTPSSVILVGDLNARTYEKADSVDCTSLCNALQIPELQDTHPPPQLRQNRNVAALSGWYKELLGLCGATDYHILNGRLTGDLTGEYTCLANHDHDTVDYMIASPEMFEAAQHLEVLTNPTYCGSKQSESDHRPLALRFVVQFSTSASTFDNNTPSPMIHFKYNPAFVDKYSTQLQHSLSIDTNVLHLQDMPATNLVEFLHNHICNNDVFGHKQPPSTHRHYHKPWFDTECRVEKRHVMTFLKDNPESEFARTLQRNLKQMFKCKKRSYEKLRGMRLCKMAKADPVGFWRRYGA